METVTDYFLGLHNHSGLDDDCSHEIKRRLLLGRKAMSNLDSVLQSRDITLPAKVHIVKAMVFPVVMYWSESWTMKKAEHQRTDSFELWCWRRLLSPLGSKEIKPVNPKGNQSWIFIGGADAEAKAPILWPPDAKSQLIWKDPDAGKDWRQEKETTEDEMVGQHHWLKGYEFEQTLGDGKWQGSLACYSPWGCKELDMTFLRDSTTTTIELLYCLQLRPLTAIGHLAREEGIQGNWSLRSDSHWVNKILVIRSYKYYHPAKWSWRLQS